MDTSILEKDFYNTLNSGEKYSVEWLPKFVYDDVRESKSLFREAVKSRSGEKIDRAMKKLGNTTNKFSNYMQIIK